MSHFTCSALAFAFSDSKNLRALHLGLLDIAQRAMLETCGSAGKGCTFPVI